MSKELHTIRTGFWWTGVSGFVFGISDRIFAVLSWPSAQTLALLFVSSLFFVFFLFLKPLNPRLSD
ncbi:hypothetical protein [Leptolyngbya sp. FACHB-261]|uniref:hypothetical protein n=1 Tax=Leptolyngbya sp. FACHB-261 TaxID=2692806 RepID=UPI00168A15E3|nr:hypothetical protein [Leptolyngbya sp. FACHB-261]MBD2103260.1 hypothetical protein [Leptolyngbya sp. FACHB-261]